MEGKKLSDDNKPVKPPVQQKSLQERLLELKRLTKEICEPAASVKIPVVSSSSKAVVVADCEEDQDKGTTKIHWSVSNRVLRVQETAEVEAKRQAELVESIKAKQLSLLLGGDFTQARLYYDFKIVVGNEANVMTPHLSAASEMLRIVVKECSDSFVTLTSHLVQKCFGMRQINFLKKRNGVSLARFPFKIWPVFSYAPGHVNWEARTIDYTLKLQFVVLNEASLLHHVEKYPQDGHEEEKVNKDFQGIHVMNTLFLESFIIEKIHLDLNTFGLMDPDGNGNTMTIGQHYYNKVGLKDGCFNPWQALVECKKFTSFNVSEAEMKARPSVYHLPQFCCLLGVPQALRSNCDFVNSLEVAYQTCCDISNELILDFLDQVEKSSEVQEELREWGVKIQRGDIPFC